jgi:hypothetical protein
MARCTAKSKRSQERCRRAANRGATVCHMHGGSVPRVKLAAARRLADAEAMKALNRLDIRPLDHPVDELLRLGAEFVAVKDVLAAKFTEAKAGDQVLLAEAYGKALDRAHKILVEIQRLDLDTKKVVIEHQKAQLLAQAISMTIADVRMLLYQKLEDASVNPAPIIGELRAAEREIVRKHLLALPLDGPVHVADTS